MPGIRKSSKRKQGKTVPVLGAAGLSLSMVGSAAAHVGAGTADLPAQKIAPNHEITLGEEEMSDVSLATFYVFDKESMQGSRGVKVAAGLRTLRRMRRLWKGLRQGLRRRVARLRRVPRLRLRWWLWRRLVGLGLWRLLHVLGRLPLLLDRVFARSRCQMFPAMAGLRCCPAKSHLDADFA